MIRLILIVTYFIIHLLTTDNAANSNNYEYVKEIHNSSKPEIIKVVLLDEEKNNIKSSSNISDIYNVDYLASGVVGLVGVPVDISFDSDLKSLRLIFYYDENELRGIPENNLIILHHSEDQDFFVEPKGLKVDTDKNTVETIIVESGTYLLADKYEWYSTWGVDMSDFAYDNDNSDYISDWERECETGDILKIADIEWAKEKAPVFHVENKEQLAGVVYYVNALNTNYDNIELYLENDIDLKNLDWVPMGWLGAKNNSFIGTIDGQGHKISNMRINAVYENHCAFVAYSPSLTVKNITFDEARVTGGSYTGIVGGEIYGSKEWENVIVTGYIESEGVEVGSIIGREAYIHFKNCSADVRLKERGNKNLERIHYYSHRYGVIDNTPVTEDFTLTLNKDGTVTRTESDDYFQNLCWHIESNGTLLLQRGAENELTLPAEYAYKGSTIWLEAFTGETYTRVSNKVVVE